MEEYPLADNQLDQHNCGELTNSIHHGANNCDTDSLTLSMENVTSNNTESVKKLNDLPCSKSSLSDESNEHISEVLKLKLGSDDDASNDSVDSSDVVQGKRKRKLLVSDDDEDYGNDSSPIKENREIHSMDSANWRSTLLNRELYSEDDANSDEDLCSIGNIKAAAKKKLRLVEDNVEPENKKSRKSKTAAQKNISKDEIKKIHSETQRMMRDSTVSLPYHKPKQRSLAEFLNRKRVTPKTEAHLLKARPKDLQTVVQVLEHRVSEVESFFCEETLNVKEDDFSGSVTPIVKKNSTNLSVKPKESDQPSILCRESVDQVISGDTCDSHLFPVEDLNKEPTHNFSSGSELETDEIGVIPVKNFKDLNTEDELVAIQSTSSETPNQTRFENIKRLSIANKVSLKPTLSHGKPGDILDLDDEEDASAKKKSEHEKVQNLIERFVQQVNYTKQAPKERDIEINVVHKVVGADGQVELKNDVVKLTVGNDTEDLQGSASDRRQLLKDSLRKSMSAKKIAERMKKTQKKTNHENEEECEPEEEIWSEDENPDTDSEIESESEEEFGQEKEDEHHLFIEAEDSEEESDDEISIKIHLPRKSKTDNFEKESKINKTGSLYLDLKESDGLSSFEGLTPNLEESESSQEEFVPKIPSTQSNHESNIEELIQLCSGKFTAGSSRNLFGEDDLEEDAKAFNRIVPSMLRADDESATENSNDAQSKWIVTDADADGIDSAALLSDDDEGKLQFKRGKPGRILLSDDEEDEKEDTRSSASEEEEMHEEEKEYRGLNEFFENEAELSGSEVGSDDEREDEDDHWEEEEGDKEELDETELRDQVGRAHFKTLLDQDQREVRIFQELFLEDGDLHSEGGGRKRQFKWKNNDDEEGVTGTVELKSQEENDEVDDQEDDQTWRKLRNEREKWLLQQQQQKTASEVTDLSMNINWKGKAIKVNNSKSCGIQPDRVNASTPNSVEQVSNVKSIKPHSLVKRGSFLRRSEKDLSAIATLTKSALPVQAQRSGTNFVFSNLTPERPANIRKQKNNETKQDEIQASKEEFSNNPPTKRAKISSAKSIFSYF